MINHTEYAEIIYKAEQEHYQVGRITDKEPKLTEQDAYHIQMINVERKIREGKRVIGFKIGLTSKPVQAMLGVDRPDYGYLFSDMIIPSGESISMQNLIQPKVEAELSFYIGKELRGPGVTIAQVYAATEYVFPSLELIDSRIRDWDVKVEDTIADNASATGIVMGNQMARIGDVDMRLTGMNYEKNVELIASSTTAQVGGNPAYMVATLANMLAETRHSIPAGSIVMAGALTPPEPVKAGDVIRASFTGMGSVSVRFTV